jgi:hypothetical protein
MIAVPQPKALMMSSAARSSRRIFCSLLVAGSLAVGGGAAAAPPTPTVTTAAAATFVDLGTAASYSVLAGSSVANTGTGTVLAGDLGLSPAGPITGFPPGTVNGTIHDKDAAAETAQSDRADAYADAAGQETTTTFAGDQAGVTFHPGVHTTAAAFSNTGTVTLDADGDSNAVFIFQINAALSSAAGSKVVLTDGALANNVYWQVAGAISLGADAKYVGTFLGVGAIAFGDGASLKGRALTPTSVAMTNTSFLVAKDDLTAPLVTIDGGAARSTNDSTPAISGTTDEPAGTVRVTVSGQTLTATVGAGGIWAVSSNLLVSGTHAVVAAITDSSQNVGTAQQELTVDENAPVISINGGATRATNDTTPAISGTSDAAPGTPVTVTVDGQTLTTEASSDAGAWTVTAGTLAEAVHSAVASIEDGAGNTATATQVLIVDLTVPVVTINGGASRSTVDTSPWTYGTTAEQAGTTVHLTVGGQHLTATVGAGGAWGVSAATLPGGTHNVVASVTDAAQNTGTATQALTIDVPGPGVPEYRPDAAVRSLDGSLVGVDRYDDQQRVTSLLGPPVPSVSFEVRVTNRGNATDRLKILATPGNGKYKVTYHAANDQNVTRGVTAGTYRTGTLQPGASAVLYIKVTRTRATQPGDRRTFAVRVDSSHAGEWDQVLAVVKW